MLAVIELIPFNEKKLGYDIIISCLKSKVFDPVHLHFTKKPINNKNGIMSLINSLKPDVIKQMIATRYKKLVYETQFYAINILKKKHDTIHDSSLAFCASVLGIFMNYC